VTAIVVLLFVEDEIAPSLVPVVIDDIVAVLLMSLTAVVGHLERTKFVEVDQVSLGPVALPALAFAASKSYILFNNLPNATKNIYIIIYFCLQVMPRNLLYLHLLHSLY
jgi:hypothetical protein